MSESVSIDPVELRAPAGATTMEIVWSDGGTTRYRHVILRGFCPCAHCQGHGGALHFVAGGDLDLRDIEQVGLYALKFTWGDRHDSGIYRFEYLRALEAATPDSPPPVT